MKKFAIGVLAVTLLLAAPSAAQAGQGSGSTSLLGAAVSGSSVAVDVAVVSATPVVDGEFTFVNACWFGTRTSGPADSLQKDAVVGWIYSSPAPYGSVPHATMEASLVSVPVGATCKVSLLRGNTLVKGSLTTYQVTA